MGEPHPKRLKAYTMAEKWFPICGGSNMWEMLNTHSFPTDVAIKLDDTIYKQPVYFYCNK